jgi:fatty acid amide hydrolase 2
VNSEEILQLGAFEIAHRVRERSLRAHAVVDAHMERIRSCNGALNALIVDRFAAAREEALQADRLADAGSTKPLLGVPFVVKDGLSIAGLPLTAGSMRRSGIVAAEDATAVARLRAAGGIPLGLTNTSELGFWVETDNPLYGRTQNPWDLERTPGGSSGADAALVATGGAPFAVGLDRLGASVISGAMCGVFSHKPTGGLVPTTGHGPVLAPRLRRHAAVGIVARRPDDIAGLLGILAGPDGLDETAQTFTLGDSQAVDFAWRRVLVCDGLGLLGNRPTRAVRRALKMAGTVLKGQGAELEYWRPSQFARAVEIWLALTHEAYGLHDNFGRAVAEQARLSLSVELLRGAVGRPRHSAPVLAMAALERVTKGSYNRIQHFCAEGRRLQQRMETMLQDGGLLLMPAWPDIAPHHGGTLRNPRAALYAGLMNVLEFPCTHVPMGQGAHEMPVGVMLVGARGADATCLAAARVLERKLGPWRPIRPSVE